MVALKRASRRPPLIANTIAAIQPPLFNSCNCQKYRIRPGATPKLTKSARLSSSAPNFDWPLIMRDAAVDAVEHGGEHDRAYRQLHPPFGGQPDRRQPGADREQRDDVGHQHPHRDRAKPAAAGVAIFWAHRHHGPPRYSATATR